MSLQQGRSPRVILKCRARAQLERQCPPTLCEGNHDLASLHAHRDEPLADKDVEELAIPMVPRAKSIAHHLGLNTQPLMILKLHIARGATLGGQGTL